MKLDYSNKFVNLRGEITDEAAHMYEVLALLLSGDQKDKTNYAKFFGWAMKLHENDHTLDVDKADQATLKKFIEQAENLSASLRAQLVEVIDNAQLKNESKAASKSK